MDCESLPQAILPRDEDDGPQTGARGVGGHGGRSISRGGASDPLEAALNGDGDCSRHAGVLEGGRRVHALVLGQQPVDAGTFGGAGHLIERVLPSRRVTTWSRLLTIGSRSRKRQTPLWSMGSVEVRSSCSGAQAHGIGQADWNRRSWGRTRGLVTRRPRVDDLVQAVAFRAAKIAGAGGGIDPRTAAGAS